MTNFTCSIKTCRISELTENDIVSSMVDQNGNDMIKYLRGCERVASGVPQEKLSKYMDTSKMFTPFRVDWKSFIDDDRLVTVTVYNLC